MSGNLFCHVCMNPGLSKPMLFQFFLEFLSPLVPRVAKTPVTTTLGTRGLIKGDWIPSNPLLTRNLYTGTLANSYDYECIYDLDEIPSFLFKPKGAKKKYQKSQCMRLPTMWYVRPVKPQISLRIHTV